MDGLVLYYELKCEGEAFYASMNLGEQKKEVDYMKVAESFNKSKLLEILCLDGLVLPENVRAITKEEYESSKGE